LNCWARDELELDGGLKSRPGMYMLVSNSLEPSLIDRKQPQWRAQHCHAA
jgi:hypothetical protein